MPLTSDLTAALAAETGCEVLTDPVHTDPYSHDWWPRLLMRRRAGESLTPPDAVVRPRTRDEVVAVLRWAARNHVAIVPFAAGTGVCGGAAPVAGALTLDLKALTHIGELDVESGIVEVEPGVIAQRLEDHLAAHGWTLGHHPSSAHASTIGGFLAVRSAGQSSSLFGKMEDMVVALEVVLADGQVVTTRVVPQSSSGPDLKRLFLGGEGTTGIITRAWLRVRPTPEVALDRGWLVDDLQAGVEALRAIVRTGAMPAILRLYDETDTAMVFGGQEQEVPDGCLLIVGCEGRHDVAAFTEQVASGELARLGAQDLGRGPGEHWRANRHGMSYRFADYVKPGGTFGDALTLDTMEVAGRWRDLPALYEAVRGALAEHVDLVLAHISHVYDTGASIYFTLGAVNEGDEDRALARYDAAWEAGQRAALDLGATASHHHGIGLLRAPHLPVELGDAGWDVLRRVKAALDPDHRLNPGKLGLLPPDGLTVAGDDPGARP